MIMIREEHLIPSIGEKIHRHVHSAHDFISIRQYCFTADMVNWTEKQSGRSSLCHFPIPKWTFRRNAQFSKRMHNFLKVSDFRKCSSFPKYKFVMTTSTENYEDECFIFFKKSAISKNHHKFYFSVYLTSYTNLMSHFSRAFINCFPNVITLTKQQI